MTRQTPALFFFLSVALALALWYSLKPDPQSNALRVREMATRGLAEHLARNQPGKRVLVLSNPFSRQPGIAKAIVQTEEAGVRGLRKGFADKLTIGAVAFPELSPGVLENPRAQLIDADTTTPLSYLVAPDGWDRAARQHADCEIIVSLIGLPGDLQQCESWKASGPPSFALLFPDLRVLGDTAAVRAAVNSGKLVAFVMRKPDAPPDALAPGKDFKIEFEKRFVLVTTENVDQISKTYPGLF